MTLDPSQVTRQLQDHLQEGLLIVVGTGPSIAEGIPGMESLAKHLVRTIPGKLTSAPDDGWSQVAQALEEGANLEEAMGKTNLLPTTIEEIVAETARLISNKERKVIERVLSGSRVLPFTLFFNHLFRAGKRFHLITTNYDRLIELAAEAAGIGVDSRFFGYLFGRHEPKRAADAHREVYYTGKNASFRHQPCLCVYKPHGSLDWLSVDNKIVRCPIGLNMLPVIITPGTSKYRESFRWAFDDQRTAGNRAATSATRLLFVGYGFNDDHLEQYVCPSLTLTKPTVIIVKHLTENARKVIKNSKLAEVTALSAVSETDLRTRVLTQQGEEVILNEPLWNLEGFNKGVL